MARKKTANTETPASEVITSFKGFDKDLSCRGFKFEVGETYAVEGEIKACSNGFHACGHPFDVWGYYPPGESRYAIVEQFGHLSRHSEDSKAASAAITIKAELSLPEFVSRGVEYLLSKVLSTKVESNTGYRSAATNTGYQSAATNTGDRSAATVEGKHSVAVAIGIEGRAKASATGAIVLVYRDPENDWAIKHIFAARVGEHGIKADTFYTLNADGLPVEVEG